MFVGRLVGRNFTNVSSDVSGQRHFSVLLKKVRNLRSTFHEDAFIMKFLGKILSDFLKFLCVVKMSLKTCIKINSEITVIMGFFVVEVESQVTNAGREV